MITVDGEMIYLLFKVPLILAQFADLAEEHADLGSQRATELIEIALDIVGNLLVCSRLDRLDGLVLMPLAVRAPG